MKNQGKRITHIYGAITKGHVGHDASCPYFPQGRGKPHGDFDAIALNEKHLKSENAKSPQNADLCLVAVKLWLYRCL